MLFTGTKYQMCSFHLAINDNPSKYDDTSKKIKGQSYEKEFQLRPQRTDEVSHVNCTCRLI